jgi:transcriptional regulator with XRE-family HTH domain
MYGSKIASIRLARGYTQEYLANKLGIAQNTYSKMEKGDDSKLDDAMLAKIAGVLAVSLADIKSPMPIIMNFHDSPTVNRNEPYNSINTSVIELLKQQLQQKDEQIAQLLVLLGKKEISFQ